MNPTTRRKLLIGLTALGLVLAGLLIGLLIAASATDIRNACVADVVVPRAGVPGDVVPGPRTNTIVTTPQVVTPVKGQ